MIDFELDKPKSDHTRVVVRMVIPDVKTYNKNVREIRRLADETKATVAVSMA